MISSSNADAQCAHGLNDKLNHIDKANIDKKASLLARRRRGKTHHLAALEQGVAQELARADRCRLFRLGEQERQQGFNIKQTNKEHTYIGFRCKQ
jgi:hypothetical protein